MTDIKSHETILIVEDTKADYIKIERSLKKARLANPLIHIEHGDDALEYLTKSGKYKDNKDWVRPGLVLLDINLPGANGLQILETVKSTKNMKKIPIIMMTTSSECRDVDKSYELGANSYVVKPFSSTEFFEAMVRIRDYWFSLVVLPESKGEEN